MFGGTGGPFFGWWGTPGATAQDLGQAAGQWYQTVSGTQGQGAHGGHICNSKNTAVSREAKCRQRNATRSYTEYR
jgi:hypothetical protein